MIIQVIFLKKAVWLKLTKVIPDPYKITSCSPLPRWERMMMRACPWLEQGEIKRDFS